MKKPIEVVMLPTKDTTHIKMGENTKQLFYVPELLEGHSSWINQYLYITVSQDVEPIKVGDWIIKKPSNKPHQVKDIKYLYESDRKIIATDDSSLFYKFDTIDGIKTKRLPQVSQSFLKEFVVNPNGKWEVEYEELSRFDVFNMVTEKITTLSTMYELKLNQDNTVNITSVKEKMYSKAEFIKGVLKMQHDYTKYKENCHYGPNMREIAEWTDNWIKENL